MLDQTIMLDVDGVLGATIVRVPDGVEVRVPAAVVARLRTLADLAPITWATTWDAEIRSRLSEVLKLPNETESLAIVPSGDPIEAKRRALDRFLRLHEPDGGWQAVVWIDDGIRQTEREWASGTTWPLTLVKVDAVRLLSDDDVEATRQAVRTPSC